MFQNAFLLIIFFKCDLTVPSPGSLHMQTHVYTSSSIILHSLTKSLSIARSGLLLIMMTDVIGILFPDNNAESIHENLKLLFRISMNATLNNEFLSRELD